MGHTTNYDSKKYKLACKNMREIIQSKWKGYFVYHIKNVSGIIVGSVCIIETARGEYVRGISIKSPSDNCCKSVGTFWAMRRAIRSAKKDFIETFTELRPKSMSLLGKFREFPEIKDMVNLELPVVFKCEDRVDLTKYEIKMLERKGNAGDSQ